jgi:hypothetical protein
VESIDALGDSIAKVIVAFFELINPYNLTVYLLIIVLFVLLRIVIARNRRLTKELGDCRKKLENNDPYKASSNVDEYGEKRLGEGQ